MTPGPLNILFICTGNICRSPLAAQLLTAGLASSSTPDDAVRAASRGTHARGGLEMDALSARQSATHGGDPAGHRSERLTPADLREADLVVTMTLAQRAAAARMLPVASRKSVTLLELARLVEHNPIDVAAERREPVEQLQHLLSRRSAMPPPRRESELDIADPFRKSAATHAKVARQIDDAVSTLAGWLAEAVPSQPGQCSSSTAGTPTISPRA
jgi:protein-tyrosine phosphatase